MFAKETYMQRRALLKKNLGSGVLLFLGNDECGLNYEDNTFRYRQDSTFLYYFGLSCAGLSALEEGKEENATEMNIPIPRMQRMAWIAMPMTMIL